MFIELVELGRKVHKGHDALKEEKCNWDIDIDNEGNFIALSLCDISIEAEKLSAKKGRARLLLDKAEETLCFEGSSDFKTKHKNYIDKLNIYKNVTELAPVFSFYDNPREVGKALDAFKALDKNKQKGNLTFRVNSTRLVSLDCVKEAIIRKYEESRCSNGLVCSVCGTDKYPILDESHGSVKIPKGQTSGSMLVSYNTKAFESYNLKGNLNSCICTNCARNYVEALQYLLSNGHDTKEGYKYSNRQKISDDTIALFWTKEPNDNIDPFSDIYQPEEERVKNLFSSIAFGDKQRVDTDVENFFYCCTLSSAAARIAVRDWISISISQYQKNLKQWFEDIATLKEGKVYYPGINVILNNCIKKKKKPTQSDFKAKARIGTMLWHAALTKSSLPIMIMQSVLDQIEHGRFSEEKSTVIRLVLNRNPKYTYKMKKELDEQNESKAYLCGRLFALICKLQYKAQGTVNSSIKDRFFAQASNMPGKVMGMLLSKYVPVYEKKAKGAYAKSITDIAARIRHFPDRLSTMERGEFALGYYYQYASKHNEHNNEEE